MLGEEREGTNKSERGVSAFCLLFLEKALGTDVMARRRAERSKCIGRWGCVYERYRWRREK